jgi:hypothetical protein
MKAVSGQRPLYCGVDLPIFETTYPMHLKKLNRISRYDKN